MVSFRPVFAPTLLLSFSLVASGCASSASDPSADDGDDTTAEDLSRCRPLVEANAAKLMPAGASEVDGAGSFVVQTASRGNNDVTGAGPWSDWSDYGKGSINLYAEDDIDLGPIVSMRLYNPDDSSPTWDIDANDGLVADGRVNYRTTEVNMYLQHIGDYGTIATFQTKNIHSSTCSFTATSDNIKMDDATEMRVRVKATFKKPKSS